MNIDFHKSLWEARCTNELELTELLQCVKQEGYQGTELFLPFYSIDVSATLSSHKDHHLEIITGIATEGVNFKEHLDSLRPQVEHAMTFSPKLINCHTGRDIFSLKNNLLLFEQALKLEHEYGITITHETHRFRPTFSTFGTEQLINELPDIKINLDISHWMVVHESDLSDQQETLAKLFTNVYHIHARVGFEEGPQVADPQDSRWASHLKNHTNLWQQVITQAYQRGDANINITPEFGPFPYAQVDPETGMSVTDIWAANSFIRQHLQENLTIK